MAAGTVPWTRIYCCLPDVHASSQPITEKQPKKCWTNFGDAFRSEGAIDRTGRAGSLVDVLAKALAVFAELCLPSRRPEPVAVGAKITLTRKDTGYACNEFRERRNGLYVVYGGAYTAAGNRRVETKASPRDLEQLRSANEKCMGCGMVAKSLRQALSHTFL